MKYCLFVCLCLLRSVLAVEFFGDTSSRRDARKLFGGYRITPRFCKPTRQTGPPLGGPNICMFNHECGQRGGQVVGACMDGFLFGACCQLPAGSSGELIDVDNHIASTTMSSVDIMSNGVSHITHTLLNPGILPTAQDNVMVQISESQPPFSTTGVTHTTAPETLILNGISNSISSTDFKAPTKRPEEDRKTTIRIEDSTVPYSDMPTIHISISPPSPQKPMFRPKPSEDKYVLVPTISNKPNKTQEVESIVNILQMLNASTSRPPSTSYVFSSTPTRRPTTSNVPPSTSYVYSTTFKPNRTTTSPTRRKTTTKKTPPRPSGFSTVANSPAAFTQRPSTSYIYGNTPTRRPSPTVDTHIAGPGFTVTSSPTQFLSSTYASPPPTLIVLSPATDEVTEPNRTPEPPYIYSSRPPYPRPSVSKPITNSVTINNHVTQNIYSTSERPLPTVLITPKPSVSTPDNEAVEIGNDQLSNFPPVRNPNLNMSNPVLSEDDITTPEFVEDEALMDRVDSFVNKIVQGLQEPFQGLRDVVYNRNTSLAAAVTTTKKPTKKQGTTTKKPATKPSSSRPTRPATTRPATTRPVTTRPATTRPVTTRPSTTRPGTSRPGTTRPGTTRPGTSRPATTRITTRRTTTVRRPASTVGTRRPTTTTKRTKTTKRPPTTQATENNTLASDNEQYRDQCGIRPLMKTGRIVGGKAAMLGEFPWQVLVRESTWLGLFTKNKCGGVLISNRYVMTAAHCQPGFLASLVAVFGELDISGDLEKRKPVTRNVKRVVVHRKYDPATFANDLALLELESPVKFDAHIIPICLPRDGEDFTGRMATVTGWGRLKYGGGVPSMLQEVQVPIMENHVCQDMFQTAGHTKVILDSFLCAGYANGQKDSCEGDSGGPLVLQRPDGRYQLAGTVSHGIKCAAPYLPGVYMRTTYFKPWIVAITGVDTSSRR